MMKGIGAPSWQKTALRAGVTAAALLATFSTLSAQEARAPKPGPIEFTVGTGPGGTPDVIVRHVARILNETGIVKRPLVVKNRVGGAWTVAGNYVVGKPGNEHTVLYLAGPLISTPIIQGLPPVYDKITPICMFAKGDVAVAVHADSGITNLKQLFARARKQPELIVGGAHVGTVDQLVTDALERAGHVKFNYIPFKGGGAAMTAFLGKNTDINVISLYEAIPLLKAHKINIVAVMTDERPSEPPFDKIPTAKEQGYDIDMGWAQAWGLAGPPNLDPAVVKWWEQKIAAMVKTKQWKQFVKESWLKTNYGDAAAAKQFMLEDLKHYNEVLPGLGLIKKKK